MFIHHTLLLASLPWLTVVHARHNVTLDDQDPSISYVPAPSWSLSANSSLNAGGAHMLTQDKTATATLIFTGVAVYFMSPLWPYLVNTAISLDSAPPVLVDLVDHTRPNVGEGMETVQSQVVWGASGLSNTQHKLVISVGEGQPFAIVDMLIYTALDPEDLTTTSSATPSATSATTVPITSDTPAPSTSTSSTTSGSTSKHVLPIALGTVLGLLALLIIVVAFWFCYRRRKRPVSEAWTVAGDPYTSFPQMASVPNGAPNYAYPQTYDYGHGGDGWGSPLHMQQVAQPTSPSIPGVTPIAGALVHPYARATGITHDASDQHGPWSGAVSSTQQQLRAPNRYQPNTLSTITENSTPPIGGGTPLLPSPSSGQTDLFHDAHSHASERTPSLPNESPTDSFANRSHLAGNGGILPKPQGFGRLSDRKMPPPYTPQ